jgi:hypothetical protein
VYARDSQHDGLDAPPILVPQNNFKDDFLMIQNHPGGLVKYSLYNVRTRKIKPLIYYSLPEKWMRIKKNFHYWFDHDKKFLFFKFSVHNQEGFNSMINCNQVPPTISGKKMIICGIDMVKKKLFCQNLLQETGI